VSDGTETSETRNRSAVADIDLLVVGTFAGGGIHMYVEEQVKRLREHISVSSHDMRSPPIGEGWRRFLRGIVMGIAAMIRFIVRDRPDIVHIHASHRFSFYRASVYVLFAKYVWRKPVVFHVHGSSFDEFVRTDSRIVALLQRRVFAASDEVIVLSDYWKGVVSALADSERIRIVPNAVDPTSFPIEGEASERAGADRRSVPEIVFVSNLVERKGVPELAAAVEAVLTERPGECTVTIAGDGPLSDRVTRLSERFDSVTYAGYVSEAEKRSLLAAGSIFVLPTHAEGLPIAMLEGMAGRNAVISTEVGSIPEVIDDDRGIVVRPGDISQLVDALECLLDSPEQRAEMAENNRKAVEQRFCWNYAIDELLNVYRTHLDTSERVTR
jgi:glycosyltransferase involved in cell wall biosynthesis